MAAKHATTLTRREKLPPRRPRRKSPLAVTALAVLILGGFYANHELSSQAPAPAPSRHAAAPKASASSPASATPSPAATAPLARLCGQAGWPEKSVDGGTYIVQNDEWNSTAPECITTNGGAQFTVASSSIQMPTAGDPGGYPAIYSGCSAGVCTSGSKLPILVSDLKPGTVTSNWSTTQPPGGAYDASYDIWFNQTPDSSGVPHGGELMIWLAHHGGSQVAPAGRPVAHVTIGGYAYTLWVVYGSTGGGPPAYRISYVMDSNVTSVRHLDIGAIAADAASRGYLAGASYLLNIQAGFELWQGGDGLGTKSFAVNIGA